MTEEPTQETQPVKGKPVEIPVPEKADVMAAFRKVAKADDDGGRPWNCARRRRSYRIRGAHVRILRRRTGA
jgi:hypothetical protein